MGERVFSGSELDRLAGVVPAERRTLVATGVLQPARTGAGWAVFSAQDLDTARRWKLTQRAERSSGGRSKR